MTVQTITLYTDGGSRNTGNTKGGAVRATDKSAWAALLVYGPHQKMLTGGERGRTNNYMEIMAVIQGLTAIKKPAIPVTVYSDSAYVVNTMQKRWWVNWQRNGWLKAGQPVANAALWQQLLAQLARFDQVTFTKVKGHADDPLNNAVDAALNRVMDEMG